MTDLELIKAFAELEGVDLITHRGEYYRLDLHGSLSINNVGYSKYNPITDLALNCAARDKYGVEIDYTKFTAYVDINGKWACVPFKSKEDVPRAVIECILKSEGKL